MWTSSPHGSHGNGGDMSVDALILYGTEGSTARRVSEDIGQAFYRHNISFIICDMQFADATWLLKSHVRDHSIVVLVISTAGQGEVPISARQFWLDFLKIPPHAATAYGYRPYALFGLGDRKYTHFNWAAKKFVKRLNNLGACAATPPGLGDDSHAFSHFGELDSWIDDVLKVFDVIRAETTPYDFDEEHPTISGLLVTGKDSSQLRPAATLLDFLQTWLPPPHLRGGNGVSPLTPTNWMQAAITGNARLTAPEHFQDVRHITLYLPADFKTGDILCVWPHNTHPIIDQVFDSLEWDSAARLNPLELGFINDPKRRAILEGRSLEEVFRDCLDLMCQPSRAWLYNLRNHCPFGIHRDKLAELAGNSPDSLNEYMRYIVSERRSLADVLIDFAMALEPSALRFTLASAPIVVPRRYSIANAPQWYPCQQLLNTSFSRLSLWGGVFQGSQLAYMKLCRQMAHKLRKSRHVDLCVAVKQDTTFLRRKIQGVCSAYLSGLTTGDKILCRVETPNYDVNAILNSTCPLLFFGTGTGCAPLRALLQHMYIHEMDSKRERCVYLGFRRPDRDFIFRHDWGLFAEDPHTMLHVAFSRADEAHKKIYIQDLVEDHAQEVAELLSKDPKIFIAGRSHPMPAQVMDSLTLCCPSKGGDGSTFLSLDQRRLRGDIIFDTWGV